MVTSAVDARCAAARTFLRIDKMTCMNFLDPPERVALSKAEAAAEAEVDDEADDKNDGGIWIFVWPPSLRKRWYARRAWTISGEAVEEAAAWLDVSAGAASLRNDMSATVAALFLAKWRAATSSLDMAVAAAAPPPAVVITADDDTLEATVPMDS